MHHQVLQAMQMMLDCTRPYLLSAMLFCLYQVKAFALHEPEHVKKAIVA